MQRWRESKGVFGDETFDNFRSRLCRVPPASGFDDIGTGLIEHDLPHTSFSSGIECHRRFDSTTKITAVVLDRLCSGVLSNDTHTSLEGTGAHAAKSPSRQRLLW